METSFSQQSNNYSGCTDENIYLKPLCDVGTAALKDKAVASSLKLAAFFYVNSLFFRHNLNTYNLEITHLSTKKEEHGV